MRTLLTILALSCLSFAQTTVLPKTTVFPKTTLFGAASSGGTVTTDSAPGASTLQTTAGPIATGLAISAGCVDPLLVVTPTASDAGTPSNVSAISYNGTSMLTNVIYNQTPEAGNRVTAYYLINPTHDGVSHNVSVTLNGTVAVGWGYAYYAFCGANQTTPIRQTLPCTTSCAAGIASGSPVTITIACSANDAYIQNGVWAGGQAGTLQDSATSVFNNTTDGIGGAFKLNLTGSSTPGWAIGSGGSEGSIGAACVAHD